MQLMNNNGDDLKKHLQLDIGVFQTTNADFQPAISRNI